MEPSNQQKKSIFHTDQGRWDRKDYSSDDNINRHSLQERTPDELEDHFQKPSGHVYTNDELEKVVKNLLSSSKALDSSDITVTANNGDITLSGTVKSDQQKKSASSIIRLIHGIGIIRNDIIVKINEGILPTDIGRDD